MKIFRLTFAIVCTSLLTFTTKAFTIKSSIIKPLSNSVSKPKQESTEQLKIYQMQRFAKMTLSEYEIKKGRKLNFFERLSFRSTQHRITKMLKRYDDGDGPNTLSKISWFFKGLLFGPLALILGYIFLKDDERQVLKWAWFGFAGFLIILGIVLFI